jgi:hypothetical protein
MKNGDKTSEELAQEAAKHYQEAREGVRRANLEKRLAYYRAELDLAIRQKDAARIAQLEYFIKITKDNIEELRLSSAKGEVQG